MRVQEILIAIAFAMAMFGCSQPIERFGVDGVIGEFCPPPSMVPADIAWIPEDSDSTSRGFTVSGCATRPSDSTDQCRRLRQIVSADISPRNNASFFSWKDFKNSASAIRFARDGRTRYEFHGDRLVIKNHHITDKWVILSARRKSYDQTDARPEDDDVVAAVCLAIDDFPLASRNSTGRNYGCYRHMIGPDYSSDYSFVTDSKVPSTEEISKLDFSLISQIEAWKCPVS